MMPCKRDRSFKILGGRPGASAGGGSGHVTPDNAFVTYKNNALMSTTAYASKGAIYTMGTSRKLVTVVCQTEGAASETYKLVVAKVSGVNSTIDSIEGESSLAQSPFGANTNQDLMSFHFTTPITLTSGTTYAFMLVRTDGTSTSTCSVYFPGAAGLSDANYTYVGGVRYASLDPQVGDDTFFSDNACVLFVFYTAAG